MSRHSLLFLAVLGVACLVFTVPHTTQASDYSYARVVRVSLVEGQAQVARPDAEGWEQAAVNMPLEQGYTVATGQGRAEIEFESGATARMAENTVLQITELALADGARITKLTLTQGTATFYANLASGDIFAVMTPGVQVGVAENARFRVDVYSDGSSVNVLKGAVDVNSSAGTHRVSKGSTLSYRTSEPDEVTIARSAEPDEWDKWVASRENVIQTATNNTLQYMNSPYGYGLADLSMYGSWYPIYGYGMGWRPYGATLSWAPFMTGAWGYYPAFGWTWCSYEPWGWLPYHYGGWVYSPAVGWLWVPGQSHVWRPATVTFVRVGNQVGWVPLHPHDRPDQTPTNLQRGVVVPNANGFVRAHPYARVALPGDGQLQVLAGAPKDFGPGRVAPPAPGAFTSHRPISPAGSSASAPGAAPSSNAARPRVFYDQREHRWMNSSNASARPTPAAGPAPASAPAMVVTPQSAPQQNAQPRMSARPNDFGGRQRPADGPDRAGRPAPPAQYAPAPQMQQRQTSPLPPAQAQPRQFAPPPQAPRSMTPPPAAPRPAAPPPAPRYSPPPAPAPHYSPPSAAPAPRAAPAPPASAPARSAPPPAPPPKPHQ